VFRPGAGTLRPQVPPRYKLAALGLALAALVIAASTVRGRLTSLVPGWHAPSGRTDQRLKEVLEPKIQAEWNAFKNKDPKLYGDLLAVDFIAVEVDSEGTRNKDQAVAEIARSPVNDVTLSRLDVRPLGDDAAMLTYEAFLQFRPTSQIHFLRVYVTEIWQRTDGEWKALHYQETRVK
jgi:hypothetical protein